MYNFGGKMAVKIRLKRMGRKNRPYYRIVVMDALSSRDGKAKEILGHYDPLLKDVEKKWKMQVDRAAYWVTVGAQPSETVMGMLQREGVWPRAKAVSYIENGPAEPEEQPEPKKPEKAKKAKAETAPKAEEKVEEKPEAEKAEEAPKAEEGKQPEEPVKAEQGEQAPKAEDKAEAEKAEEAETEEKSDSDEEKDKE